MKRKIVRAMLLLSMVVSCSSTLVSAQQDISQEVESSVMEVSEEVTSGTCGENAVWSYNEETATLTISGTGEIQAYPYYELPWRTLVSKTEHVVIEEGITKIADSSFSEMYSLKDIIIADTVTSIGSYAFNNCDALTSIVIPDTVTSIGYGIFQDCSGLVSVTWTSNVSVVPDSTFNCCTSLRELLNMEHVTEFGNGVFYNCSSIESFTVPETTTSLSSMFQGMSGLKEVTLNDKITTIPEYAFANCTSLEVLHNIDQIEYVGRGAFQNCTSLTRFDVPNGVLWIGDSAFYGCTSLVSVMLHKDMTSISANAFYGCTSLHDISLPEGLTSIGELAFVQSGLTKISIPEGVTLMGEQAFRGCVNLEQVNLPSTLTNIPKMAFYQCTSLKDMGLSENVTYIGQMAYSYCTSLTELTLPKTLTGIGGSAFYECTGLRTIYYDLIDSNSVDGVFVNAGSQEAKTTLVIGDNVKRIPKNLFREMYLSSISFGNSLTELGAYSFIYCKGVREIVLPDQITVLGESLFCSMTDLETVTLPKGCRVIYKSMFEYCTNLKEVKNTEQLIEIQPKAFRGCTSLPAPILPDTLEVLGWEVFSGCTSFTELIIPENIKNLGDNTFSGCSSVTSIQYNAKNVTLENAKYPFYNVGKIEHPVTVVIDDTVESLPNTLFANLYGLQEIVLGKNIKTIGNHCFSQCTGLKKITLPDSLKKLEMYTFAQCTSLETIELPKTLTAIEKNTFFNCKKLTSITIPNSVTSIGDYAFAMCSALHEVNFGKNLREIGEYAFYQCQDLSEISLPDSLEILNSYVFYGCRTLRNVEFPLQVKHIGKEVFTQCPLETTNTLENGLVTLGNWVMDYTGGSETLEVPEGMVGIAASAFDSYGNDIAKVILPESLRYIGEYAFDNCYSLSSVVAGNQIVYVGDDAFADTVWIHSEEFMGLGTYLLKYNGTATEVRIPEIYTKLGRRAFASSSVEKVIVPETVTEFGEGLFLASSLTSIVLEGREDMTFMEAIETFGREAFIRTNLVNLITESWYASEGVHAFSTDGTSYTSLAARMFARELIENGTVRDYSEAYWWICENHNYQYDAGYHLSYADGVFFNNVASCQGVALAFKAFLDEFHIPNFIMEGYVSGSYGRYIRHAWNVVCLSGGWYFMDATDTDEGDYSTYKLTPYDAQSIGWSWSEDAYTEGIEKALAEYESGSYEGASPLTFTLQEDGTYWVSDCAVLEKEIIIPDTYKGIAVTGIGKQAFANCAWLEKITIPEGIKTIGTEAFVNCIALKEIVLPSTLESIGASVWCGCVSLYNLDLSKTEVETMGDGLFMGCLSLKELHLAEDVTSIGTNLFRREFINRLDGTYNLNIYAPALSCAHDYAVENGFTFIEEYTKPRFNPFIDVYDWQFYYEPVLWAYKKQITTGTSPVTFEPELACTRAQVVTFLWRVNGCPIPTSDANPFVDVPEGEYYTKAVLWALENGITTGTSDTTFEPDATVTRGQFVTFLYRAKGEPEATIENPFLDVYDWEFYYKPVLWAYGNGVTTGTSPIAFEPDAPCTRGQVMTFLYRGYR